MSCSDPAAVALIRRRRAGHFPDRAGRPYCPARPNASDAQRFIGVLYRCAMYSAVSSDSSG